jgi:hypothetical protein
MCLGPQLRESLQQTNTRAAPVAPVIATTNLIVGGRSPLEPVMPAFVVVGSVRSSSID